MVDIVHAGMIEACKLELLSASVKLGVLCPVSRTSCNLSHKQAARYNSAVSTPTIGLFCMYQAEVHNLSHQFLPAIFSYNVLFKYLFT